MRGIIRLIKYIFLVAVLGVLVQSSSDSPSNINSIVPTASADHPAEPVPVENSDAGSTSCAGGSSCSDGCDGDAGDY